MTIVSLILVGVLAIIGITAIYVLYHQGRKLKGWRLLQTLQKGNVVSCMWPYAASLFDSEGKRKFVVVQIFPNAALLRALDNMKLMSFTLASLADFEKENED
jgi:hypothetical protein